MIYLIENQLIKIITKLFLEIKFINSEFLKIKL